jgi:hypothetical protein
MAAVKFAVQMTKRSIKSWPPPIYTPPKLPTPNPEIHKGYVLASDYKSDGTVKSNNDENKQTKGQ